MNVKYYVVGTKKLLEDVDRIFYEDSTEGLVFRAYREGKDPIKVRAEEIESLVVMSNGENGHSHKGPKIDLEQIALYAETVIQVANDAPNSEFWTGKKQAVEDMQRLIKEALGVA